MDVDKLQQALINIVKNSLESMTGTGSIDIVLEKQPGRPGGRPHQRHGGGPGAGGDEKI